MRKDGRLRYYASRDFVVVVTTPLATIKICRISFGKDGSIYVSFPYCREKTGILNRLEKEGPGPQTIQLGIGGTKVSTDVKFSHHTSGLARFSKTGSVTEAPRNHSFPLDGPIGHVFDLHVYWLGGFDVLDRKRLRKKDLYIGFGCEQHPEAVHINAQWRRRKDIVRNAVPPNGEVPPTTQVQHRASGNRHGAHFLGQPPGYPLTDHVLMLSGGPIPRPTGADRAGMVFLGGWNPHEKTESESPTAKFGLVFMYPAGDSPPSEPDESE